MQLKLTGLSKTDIDKMLLKMNLADKKVIAAVRRIIEVLVEKLKEEAIKRVPVDEGLLEKSFSTTIVDAVMADLIEGHVFIASNAPASDYALFMHEWTYNLGKKSKEKQAATGIDVGRKYLERALEDSERAFGLYIYKKLKETIA